MDEQADGINMRGSPTQAGFYYQNNIAAIKVLDMLGPGSRIEHIVLENADGAQHVDDVVVHHADGAEYIQVKWARDDHAKFTLHSLLTSAGDGKKPLFRQLADGFKSLSGDRAKIILCTTKGASDRRRPSEGLHHGLHSLIRDIILPANSLEPGSPLDSLPAYGSYADTLSRMRNVSGLTEKDFVRFIQCLNFQLDQPALHILQEQVRTRLVDLGIGREKYDLLLNQVVEWSISGEKITRESVERNLGLLDRFVDGIAQVFPVQKEYFVACRTLFTQLDEAIDQLPGGFILLEGPPGSGKSTALTMYRKGRADIALGYYCYIPDDRSFGNRRLERNTFLKHLCQGISDAFPSVSFPEWYSEDYAAKLDKWLQTLSELGRKVVLLVDGLDHVYRLHSHLSDPLTHALAGVSLPDHIFFLLSSQHLEALPPPLRRAIKAEPLRRRVMPGFSKTQIVEFARKRGLTLDEMELPLMAEKSEGNPLYLRYICELLKEKDSFDRRSVLDRLPKLADGKITAYHEMLYDDLSQDVTAIAILAILAHSREFITKDILTDLLGRIGFARNAFEIGGTLDKIRHMLKVKNGRGFAIFHNSFGEFVREKTEEHAQIVEEAILANYREHPDTDEAFRNRYQLLFNLKRHDEILSECADEWLRVHWRAFRPLQEMKRNLNIAWQSTVEKEDFVAFIRLALLVQELGVIEQNLVTNEHRMEEILLNCGLAAQAERRIWDGERICCELAAFCAYAIAYCLHTRRKLPAHMAELAFEELKRPEDESGLKDYFCARALYVPWQDVFEEILKMRWSTRTHFEPVFQPMPENEQAEIQLGMMTGVLDLFENVRAWDPLHEIALSPDVPGLARARAVFRLTSLDEAQDRVEELEAACAGVDFLLLSVVERANLLVNLRKRNLSNLLETSCGLLPVPEFVSTLTKTGMSFGIRTELFDLYPCLQAHLLLYDKAYATLSLVLDGYPEPAQSVCRAMLDLAHLWCDTIESRVSIKEQLTRLKKVFNLLNIPVSVKRQSENKRENDPIYIQRDIHRFYTPVFEYARDFVPVEHLQEIVRHWLDLDSRNDGYKSGEISLYAAKILHSKYPEPLRESLHQLLRCAEKWAKSDEETTVLVSELLRCMDAYGICGFGEDVRRLWDEVFTCACGVGYRKDYQFNEAVDALVLAHEVSPEKTTGRLATLLARARQLAGAVRNQTTSIAVESLIEVAARIWPELGFKLVSSEDQMIFRDRALSHIVQDALTHQTIPLRHLWAMVRTMNKWENHWAFDEETYPAMREVFRGALEHGDDLLTREIYEFSLHFFVVEKGMAGKVREFVNMAADHGLNWPSAWRSASVALPEDTSASSQNSQDQTDFDPHLEIPRPDFHQLRELSEKDFGAMLQLLEKVRREYRIAERKKETKELLRRVGQPLCKSYQESLAKPGLGWTIGRAKKGLQFFHQFQQALFLLDEKTESQHTLEVQRLFDTLIDNLALALGNKAFKDHLLNHLDSSKFIRDLASQTWRDGSWFKQKVILPHIKRLLEESRPGNLQNWEAFCRKHLSSDDLSKAFFVIARRKSTTSPEQAVSLLEEAWRANDRFFYLSGKEFFHSFFDMFFRLDAKKAKKLLLRSFQESYGAHYGSEVIYRLDFLTRYAPHFSDDSSKEKLFELHDRYNKRLFEGLSPPTVDYGWVAGFEASMSPEKAVVAYLVELFSYPQVEIRKLALESLAWLHHQDEQTLVHVIDISEDGGSITKQHAVLLLHKCALGEPALANRFKETLLRWGRIPHFRLRQSVKELLLATHHRLPFLSDTELAFVRDLNMPSLVVIQKILTPPPPPASKFVPSLHLVSLLHKSATVSSDQHFHDRLYQRIQQKGWDAKSGLFAESEASQNHNINTNFDEIEVEGAYCVEVDDALNEQVAEEIDIGSIAKSDVPWLGRQFRLYDPSSTPSPLCLRPNFVNWLPADADDQAFLSFDDIATSAKELQSASDENVWLYQDGHQRETEDSIRGVKRTTYFRLIAFAASPEMWEDPQLLSHVLNGCIPCWQTENMYRSELVDFLVSVPRWPVSGVQPLVGVSFNRFRGQKELSLAAALPALVQDLDPQPEATGSLCFVRNGTKVMEFMEWMEPYDQNRRRQKPMAAGVGLRVDRQFFEAWLSEKNLSLAYHLEVFRSTDRYKPEQEMKWSSYRGVLAKEFSGSRQSFQLNGRKESLPF